MNPIEPRQAEGIKEDVFGVQSQFPFLVYQRTTISSHGFEGFAEQIRFSIQLRCFETGTIPRKTDFLSSSMNVGRKTGSTVTTIAVCSAVFGTKGFEHVVFLAQTEAPCTISVSFWTGFANTRFVCGACTTNLRAGVRSGLTGFDALTLHTIGFVERTILSIQTTRQTDLLPISAILATLVAGGTILDPLTAFCTDTGFSCACACA
jgi:hypothetical protein